MMPSSTVMPSIWTPAGDPVQCDRLPHLRLHSLVVSAAAAQGDIGTSMLDALYRFARVARKPIESMDSSRLHFPPELVCDIQTCLNQLAAGDIKVTDDARDVLLQVAYNAVFWTGICTSCTPLVRVAMAECRWQLCPEYRDRLPGVLVERPSTLPSQVWSLLVADRRRFGLELVADVLDVCFADTAGLVVSKSAGTPRETAKMRRIEAVVGTLLREPQVEPGLVWDRLLKVCLERMVQPRAVHVGRALVNGGWQFARLVVNQGLMHGRTSNVLGTPDSRLLLDLPFDVQLHLSNFLDLHDIRQLQSACRALHDQFPLGRFQSLDKLEHELHDSSLPGYVYDSARVQSLVDSVPHNQCSSTLNTRILVEAVRHLDMDLAMLFLDPPRSTNRGLVANYAYPWALSVLLFESNVQSNVPGAQRLLPALLTYPELPGSAWILPALAFSQTTRHLLPLVEHVWMFATTPRREYLLHLLGHGTIPAAAPPNGIFAELSDPHRDAPTVTMRVLIALVFAHFNPQVVMHLVEVLGFRPVCNPQLRAILVRTVVAIVPVPRLVACGNVKLLVSVFRWMVLELDGAGGACAEEEEAVLDVAIQVGRKLKEVASQRELGVDGAQVKDIRALCKVGDRRICAVKRAMQWRRVKEKGRRLMTRAVSRLRGTESEQSI
ncbi:hypothetical protein BCR44DRAFT_92105 [Catenaria anguillulae PL171]|uniref:F-box domain-containing protein n=1 Tax=Catenaria anguillulae PL171 TaxID=765915 RepID=A0A1Y2I148_9FUNG|nr:hypothetical protein BCR44DRAFT_92105 [Catenaria anguillulae PL171]